MTVSGGRRQWRIDLRRVTFNLLWLFIFCVPWEEEVVLPYQIAFSHVIGAVVAVLALTDCIRRRSIRRPATLHYMLAGLVVWAVLSYTWSVAPELTLVRASSYIQLLLMVWMIWEFSDSFDRQVKLLIAYVLGSWISAGSTIYSFVTASGTSIASYGRYTAAGTNENELGIILALGIGMACHLLRLSPRLRILWLISIPVFFVCILLTGSRGSFLASMVAMAFLPLSLRRFSLTFAILSGLGLLCLLVMSATMLPPMTQERLRSIPAELSEGTLTKRRYIWSAGLEVYRDHPLIGVGAGAYGPSVYDKLDIAYVAHNSYLSILVELGEVGFFLFVAFLLALFYAASILPRESRMAWLFLLGTWAVAVSSVTWEHRKPTWFLFGMLIAQVAALRPSRLTRFGSTPRPQRQVGPAYGVHVRALR